MTTYYVANNGNDAADGLSTGTPWKTLAKVNGFTFQAGDTILLNRGDRWLETLTPPRSSLTVGAYGADPVTDTAGYVTNAPVIDGGITVTGWSSYLGGAPYEYAKDDFAGTAGAELSTTTMEIGGPWVRQTTFSGSNTLVLSNAGRVRRGTAGLVVYYATATPPSADYAVEADFTILSLLTTDPSRLAARTDTVAQTQYTMGVDPAGNVAFSKFVAGAGTGLLNVPFTWNVGQTYKLRMEVEGSKIRGYVDGVRVDNDAITDTAIFSTGKAGLRMGGGSAPAPSDTTGIHVDNFRVFPIGAGGVPVNTYQATLAAEAKVASLRGSYAKHGLSTDTLNDGEFFWLSGKLYVRSDAGQPSNTDVIGGQRDNGINCGTLSNTTIQDVAIENTNDRAIVHIGGSGAVLRRVMAQRTSGELGNNGTFAFQTHTNWTVDQCVIRNVGSDGIYAVTTSNPAVTNSRIGPCFGPNADCLQIDSADGVSVNSTITGNWMTQAGSTSPKGCLILFGNNHVVTDNYMERTNNFGVSCPGSSFTVARNVFYRIAQGGAVRVMDNPPGIPLDGHLVHHNVMIECMAGILVGSGGSGKNRTNQRYIANTIYNQSVAPSPYQVWSTQPLAGEFKDNILWNASGTGGSYQIQSIVSGQSWDSDYNLIGPEATGFISFTGTAYDTLAAYSAGKAQDTHSLTADPMFLSPGGSDGVDYAVSRYSPARNKAVAVTGIVDTAGGPLGAMGLAPIPRWLMTPAERWAPAYA